MGKWIICFKNTVLSSSRVHNPVIPVYQWLERIIAIYANFHNISLFIGKFWLLLETHPPPLLYLFLSKKEKAFHKSNFYFHSFLAFYCMFKILSYSFQFLVVLLPCQLGDCHW